MIVCNWCLIFTQSLIYRWKFWNDKSVTNGSVTLINLIYACTVQKTNIFVINFNWSLNTLKQKFPQAVKHKGFLICGVFLLGGGGGGGGLVSHYRPGLKFNVEYSLQRNHSSEIYCFKIMFTKVWQIHINENGTFFAWTSYVFQLINPVIAQYIMTKRSLSIHKFNNRLNIWQYVSNSLSTAQKMISLTNATQFNCHHCHHHCHGHCCCLFHHYSRQKLSTHWEMHSLNEDRI